MVILRIAIAAVAPALSRTPRTSRVAAIMTTSTAGRLITPPSPGPAESAAGELRAEQAVQQLVDVLAPPDGDRGDRDAVLQQQTPADEERDAFAEGRVGEGVGAAGDRDGAAQLGEGEGGEDAGDRGQHEGEHDRGARLGDGVGQADEDAGPDDGADTEAHQLEEPHGALEAVPLQVGAGLGDQLVGILDARPGRVRGARWAQRTHGGWSLLWWSMWGVWVRGLWGLR